MQLIFYIFQDFTLCHFCSTENSICVKPVVCIYSALFCFSGEAMWSMKNEGLWEKAVFVSGCLFLWFCGASHKASAERCRERDVRALTAPFLDVDS